MNKRLDREELVALVETIFRCEASEEKLEEMQGILEKNLIDLELSNYMYWSNPQMTAEEVVDKALAFKPIILPGPDGSPEDDA